MLTLAVIALILPAAYRLAAGEAQSPRLGMVSVWISLVLIAVYAGARWWNDRATTEPYPGSASEVALVKPAADARVSLPVALTWHAVREAHQYDVEVLDAGGQPVHRGSGPDTTATIAAPALVAGDYHWSVVARRADGTVVRSGISRFSVR